MRERDNNRDWEKTASILSGETEKMQSGDQIYFDHDLEEVASLWNQMEKLRPEKEESATTDIAWKKLKSTLGLEDSPPLRRAGRFSLRYAAGIAAIILIAAGLSWGTWSLFFSTGTSEVIMLSQSSGDDRNIELALADGSSVILNSNSSLRYPSRFTDAKREVELDGEALFNVSAGAESPFIVKAGNANIEVVGTTFSVNTRIEGDKVEVFVESGKVVLKSPDDSERKVLLEAGQIGTASSSGEIVSRINTNRNYLSWNTEVLMFDGETLSEVFTELNRAYGLVIVVDDKTIMENTITTVFERLTAEEIVKIISTTFNLTYRKDGDIYVLSR